MDVGLIDEACRSGSLLWHPYGWLCLPFQGPITPERRRSSTGTLRGDGPLWSRDPRFDSRSTNTKWWQEVRVHRIIGGHQRGIYVAAALYGDGPEAKVRGLTPGQHKWPTEAKVSRESRVSVI